VSNDWLVIDACLRVMDIVGSMDVESLRWFQSVAEGATVTETSRLAHMTQSGVSRALDRLGREVGAPLLEPHGRLLRPTRAGELFKAGVDRALAELDGAASAVRRLTDPEQGTVALAFHLSFGTWLVPDLVGSFLTQNPQVRFELKQLQDDVIAALLDEGRVDLVITSPRPPEPDIEWHRLLAEPLCLAVPPGHRLAGRRRVRLAEVGDDPLVTLTRRYSLRAAVEALCEQAGFRPRIAFEGEDLLTMHGFVAAGLGVAVVPAPRGAVAETGRGDLRFLRLADPLASREVGLAWSARRPLPPAAEAFWRHGVARAAADAWSPAT